MKPIVLYSHNGKNTAYVATRLAESLTCPMVAVTDAHSLGPYDTVIFVMPVLGDEELHPAMEDYLTGLKVTGKRYCVCELGNFLGLPYVGCHKIVERILNDLGWTPLTCISIDSLPTLDAAALERWIDELRAL